MNNILVTGSNGQVGNELRVLSKEYNYNFFFTDKSSLDITNKLRVDEFIDINNIDIIINAASYTSVDQAENNQELVNLVNNIAVENIAQSAKDKNIKFIHISTDYVFDGKANSPYVEGDITNPMGIYGKSKLDGENAMLDINPSNSIIIRTSWVYSSFGSNFVKTMLRIGKEKNAINIVSDQVGTPTYARDLARTIFEILPKVTNINVEIYHYSNEGIISWYDFAQEIMARTKTDCQVNPIKSKDYPTIAKRPVYAPLNKSKIKKEFAITIPYWKDSLDKCLKTLKEDKK